MQLLTHGNSSSLSQKLSKSRFERGRTPGGNFESYDSNTLNNTLNNPLNNTLSDDNLVNNLSWSNE